MFRENSWDEGMKSLVDGRLRAPPLKPKVRLEGQPFEHHVICSSRYIAGTLKA